MTEIWKDIEGFEGIYQVSNLGRVRSLDRYVKSNHNNKMLKKGTVMKLQLNHKGYKTVMLHKENKACPKVVHRLVAQAFIPNPNNLPQVNHIDTDKNNNAVSNLEWITNADNIRHAFANGCFRTTEKQREAARKKQPLAVEKLKRKVFLCDDDGNPIEEFQSIQEASKKTGASASKITAVCRGYRNKTKGMKWKYKENVNE